MSEKVVNYKLDITKQPENNIRFLKSCENNELSLSLSKDFYKITLECLLERLDEIDLPNINLYVHVQAVVDNSSNLVHPFKLKCFNSEKRLKSKILLSNSNNLNISNSYLFAINKETKKCLIDDLYMASIPYDELKEYIENLSIEQNNSKNQLLLNQLANSAEPAESTSLPQIDANQIMDLSKNKESVESLINSYSKMNLNLNRFRFKLQVIMHNLSTNRLENYLTEPIYTNSIESGIGPRDDSRLAKAKQSEIKTESPQAEFQMLTDTSITNLNNLRILRSSRICGSIAGGDEMFLLTSFFNPFDIEVEFIQFKKDTEIAWRSLASLDRTDTHGNCSLIVKTPKYLSASSFNTMVNQIKNETENKPTTTAISKQIQNTNMRIKVYYRLFRPSTKEYSEKFAFYYFNDASNEFKDLFSDKLLSESPILNKLISAYKPFLSDMAEAKKESIKEVEAYNEDVKLIKDTLIKNLPDNHHLVKKIANNFKFFEMMENIIKLNSKQIAKSNDAATNEKLEAQSLEIEDTVLNYSNINNEIDTEDSNSVILLDETSKSSINDQLDSDGDDDSVESINKKLKLQEDTKPTANKNSKKRAKNSKNKLPTKPPKVQPYSDSDSSQGFSANLADSLKKLNLKDMSIQTDIAMPNPKTLEDLFAKKDDLKLPTLEAQLRSNLDNCIAKMNALADRTGKALLKFAKTRSFHELLKTQRFLINVQDEEGNTPIHLCILYGNLDLLEIFVDVAMTIPYQNLINIKNQKQLTPLLVACYLEEVEVCEFLLEANADLAQTDIYGCNAIHIACNKRNINLLKTLIKYVDKNCNYGVVNSINHDGLAPVHLAVMNQSVELVQELLYLKYLKINIQDKRAGYTALHHACGKQNLYQIANLLVRNESIDVDVRSYNGCTPLHVAIANKNYLITCLLLNKGAKLDIQSDSPVHCDSELFALTLKKDNLLKRCIEFVLKDFNEKLALNLKKSRSDDDDEVGDEKMENDEKFEELASKTSDGSISKELITALDLNDVKLSQEIKKIYDTEYDKEKLDDFTDAKSKNLLSQHNYDAFYYAQNDPWVCSLAFKHYLFL